MIDSPLTKQAIDYDRAKQAIVESTDIEQLKKTGSMPPVPFYTDDQAYIFISYSHRNYKEVYYDLLEFHRRGLPYWYDEGLPAGEDWDKVVEEHIKNPNCAGVIFYMSRELFLSRSVSKEIEITSGEKDGSMGKRCFSINLSGTKPSRLVHTICRDMSYEELDQMGFNANLSRLCTVFSDGKTYISKNRIADIWHMEETVRQAEQRFGVKATGTPLSMNSPTILPPTEAFDIKNGVLRQYKGTETRVVIPQQVTEIQKDAFRGCSHITRVELPAGISAIADETFADCKFLSELVLPNSVVSIGNNAFSGCVSLSALELPESVSFIGRGAFTDCSALREIGIPGGVTSIRNNTFSGCTALQEVRIPGSVTFIGQYAFSDCKALREFKIPREVTSITEGTFSGCSKLRSVELPNCITSIGRHAFSDCKSLLVLALPGGVTSIGESALSGCKRLTEIRYAGTSDEFFAIKWGKHWNIKTGKYTVRCIDGKLSKLKAYLHGSH